LRDVIETGSSDAWSELACGSLSSGLALANGGLGAAHGLASVLGGAYPAPHGALCGRLLMPVMRATLQSPLCTAAIRSDIAFCQDAIAQMFAPTKSTDPCSGFERWVDAQDLPRLSSWGLRIDQIGGVAQTAVTASSSLKNSVKLDINELAQVLRDAL
jgi:alcohol dehydrogenase class IV